MIPKIIHYCWFGPNKPRKVIKTIESWKKKLPDYKFIEWNESNFNINESCDFVREAASKKKWAFVSDYVRLYALYSQGGIYLDTDVQLLKKFDSVLNEKMFISHESESSLCTAVIGAERGNSIVSGFLKTYEEKHFVLSESLNMVPNSELLKKYVIDLYGQLTFDLDSDFGDVHIFKQTVFCAKNIHNYKLIVSDETISIHQLDASWYGPGHKVLKKIKKIVMEIINLFRK